jgi:hypothetical protein
MLACSKSILGINGQEETAILETSFDKQCG